MRSTLRRIVTALPPTWVGRAEFHLRRSLQSSWGGPLNGQKHRQRILRDLLSAFGFKAIVETGTFRGTTTEFFARESGLPIYTVEAHPRYYAFARLRLRDVAGTRPRFGDSRQLLRALIDDADAPKSHVLFYLDALWYEDLPLAEEIELILGHWTESVVMVDDFEVPGDAGYGFADYGPGKILNLAYLEPLSRFGAVMFPKEPSETDTGTPRGCVVLATPDGAGDRLRGVASLREHA